MQTCASRERGGYEVRDRCGCLICQRSNKNFWSTCWCTARSVWLNRCRRRPTLPAHAFSAAPMHSSQTFWSFRTFGGVNRSFQFFKQSIVLPFFSTYGFPIFAFVIVRWRIHFLIPLIARVAEMAQETIPVTHRVHPVCCDKLNATLWIPVPTVAPVRTTPKSHRRVPMRFLAGKAKHLAAVPRLLL